MIGARPKRLLQCRKFSPLLSLLLVSIRIIETPVLGNGFGHLSSRRYAAYDYDLTTPQYTPDGRLLQVEYATNACQREGSSPIVSVVIGIPTDRTFQLLAREKYTVEDDIESHFDEEGDTILIMATISNPSTIEIQNTYSNSDGNGQQSDSRAQCRIIELPVSALHQVHFGSSNPCGSSVSISASTILVGLSGLLSDATSLLQTVYSHLEEEQRKFGWHRLEMNPVGLEIDAPVNSRSGFTLGSLRSIKSAFLTDLQSVAALPSETALRLSRAAADQCQKHAFGGGLRPIGASLLVAGIDCQKFQNMRNGYNQCARVSVSESNPSGRWRSRVATMKHNLSPFPGNHTNTFEVSISPPQVMVSGGPVATQTKVKSFIESHLRNLYKRSLPGLIFLDEANCTNECFNQSISPNIAKQSQRETYNESLFIRRCIQTVISSLVEESDLIGGRSVTAPTVPNSKVENFIKSDGLSKTQEGEAIPKMEVVIVSSKRGSFRLNQGDIVNLLKDSRISS